MNDHEKKIVTQMLGHEPGPQLVSRFQRARRLCDRVDGGGFNLREIAILLACLDPQDDQPPEPADETLPVEISAEDVGRLVKTASDEKPGVFLGFGPGGLCRVRFEEGGNEKLIKPEKLKILPAETVS